MPFKIDSIAQSWAVLAKAKDTERLRCAMAQAQEHLVKVDPDLALLFTPPFDKTDRNPGYIKGYPPGLRENGGQYSHAAMWFMLALAEQGEGKKLVDLFTMLNPITHAETPEKTAVYKVEPYVVAADIYSVAPFVGQGGWTWYTGAAGWMYQAGLAGILGIRKEGNRLMIKPCIPDEWPEFSVSIAFEECFLDINVNNRVPLASSQIQGSLDGVLMETTGPALSVELQEGHHKLDIFASEADDL